MINGRPLEISWAAENIPAIVEVLQLGSESGNAIADVLFGKYNPSGKPPGFISKKRWSGTFVLQPKKIQAVHTVPNMSLIPAIPMWKKMPSIPSDLV